MLVIFSLISSLSVRSTASSGYDSSESGSGSELGVGGKYDMTSYGGTSPIMRRHEKETRDILVSYFIISCVPTML